MTQPQKKRPGIVTAACIIAWFQAACCLVLGPVGPIDGVAAPPTGYGYEYGSVTLGPLDLIASVLVAAALCTGAVALMARQGWGRVVLAVAEALLILDAIWAFALVALGSVAPAPTLAGITVILAIVVLNGVLGRSGRSWPSAPVAEATS